MRPKESEGGAPKEPLAVKCYDNLVADIKAAKASLAPLDKFAKVPPPSRCRGYQAGESDSGDEEEALGQMGLFCDALDCDSSSDDDDDGGEQAPGGGSAAAAASEKAAAMARGEVSAVQAPLAHAAFSERFRHREPVLIRGAPGATATATGAGAGNAVQGRAAGRGACGGLPRRD